MGAYARHELQRPRSRLSSAHIVREKDMPREFQMVRDVQGYFGDEYAFSDLFLAAVGAF